MYNNTIIDWQCMLPITYWNRKTNTWVREKTRIIDVTEQVGKGKYKPGQGTSVEHDRVNRV